MNKELTELFKDLFDGDPWIDVNILNSLEKISYTAASKKIFSNQNSVWEIINHMIAWRETVLERITGNEIPTPEHNFFEPVETVSETAWEKTLERFKISQQKWWQYLEEAGEASFSEIYPPNKMSYFKHIHGILQHDAYHLGQINLLAKYI